MDSNNNVQNQIATLQYDVKKLKEENSSKERIISNMAKEIHKFQNELGSLRKKMKSEMQRLESKIR